MWAGDGSNQKEYLEFEKRQRRETRIVAVLIFVAWLCGVYLLVVK